MDVFEAIQNRRSIRQYKKQALPEDAVEKLVEAARLAPSAGNAQPYAIVIVKEESRKAQLSQAAMEQKDIAEVPVVFVVCADEKRAAKAYGDRGKNLYCLQDTAIAVEHIVLMAQSLGLGTCWVGAFKEKDVKRIIHAPDGMRPVALVPVGYPDESPAQRSRRPASELVHYETF
jgi:nitroreductase